MKTTGKRRFLATVASWRLALARAIASRDHTIDAAALDDLVQRIIARLLFLRMAEDRGIEPPGQLCRLQEQTGSHGALLALLQRTDARYAPFLRAAGSPGAPPGRDGPAPWPSRLLVDDDLLHAILRDLDAHRPARPAPLPGELLGEVHELFLGSAMTLGARRAVTIATTLEARKSAGVYYTPAAIVDHVVATTLGRWLAAKDPDAASQVRVLDPACGAGSFLLGAYRHLLRWQEQRAGERGLRLAGRMRILRDSIYGVDIDARAVEATRLALLLVALEGGTGDGGGDRDGRTSQGHLASHEAFPAQLLADPPGGIRRGNALIDSGFLAGRDPSPVDDDLVRALDPFDWERAFAGIAGFDVVLGNPPWGQKDILAAAEVKEYMRARYPTAAGIYDLFRPFVEKGLALTRPGGYFGMVLPDIVLLKNYQETRRHLLDSLALVAIDWWGKAFPGAMIDVATIAGKKAPAPPGHHVRVTVHRPARRLQHDVAQADFWKNDRLTFNLALTADRRAILDRLASNPRLGDHFEVHEGVHSGNMRAELFVTAPVDGSCRRLYFGRDELRPFVLRWNGRYVRLAALPARKTRQRYASTGQARWFEPAKLLVRRTGDRVRAAVDRDGYYASNNFFVVLPTRPCSLGLDGLAALLNGSFLTWYFRTIEPRTGRAFAELKIKHLVSFPLPSAILAENGCTELDALDALGRARWQAGQDPQEPDVLPDVVSDAVPPDVLPDVLDPLVAALYRISDAEARIIAGDHQNGERPAATAARQAHRARTV